MAKYLIDTQILIWFELESPQLKSDILNIKEAIFSCSIHRYGGFFAGLYSTAIGHTNGYLLLTTFVKTLRKYEKSIETKNTSNDVFFGLPFLSNLVS